MKLRVRVERGIFKRRTREGVTRYEVSFTDSDGRQRWKTVGTLAEARRLRAELVTRVASGERVAPSKVTFEEFAAEWLEQQQSRLRPTTLRLYPSAFASGYVKLGDFVFASATGGPLNHRNITRRGLQKALADSQLPKIRWHDLRHIAASALIAEGASVPYLSRVLGHANPAITLSIYTHEFARVEHADRTREQMEEAFGQLLS